MKIYIPKHLITRLPVINQFYKMVVGYANLYGNEDEDNNYYYYYYGQRIDDVTRFIEYIMPGSDDETKRTNEIQYLTALFYSVKGTWKVFDYLLDYNLFRACVKSDKDNTTMISYDSREITITIDSLAEGLDYNIFCDYLEKFLAALVWFECINLTIGQSEKTITGTSKVCITQGNLEYQKLC